MVQIEKTLRSHVRMNNANDEARNYAISAEVQVGENKNVKGIDGGAVLKDISAVATFSKYDDNLSVSYVGLGLEEQNEVNAAINGFIGEVMAKVNEGLTINI